MFKILKIVSWFIKRKKPPRTSLPLNLNLLFNIRAILNLKLINTLANKNLASPGYIILEERINQIVNDYNDRDTFVELTKVEILFIENSCLIYLVEIYLYEIYLNVSSKIEKGMKVRKQDNLDQNS
ncbi:hypothetical protein BpHYR1_025777 [Brachionus plicatilis]|uniref:Uncharacterized protein n=1 Tax=Brachionus plicatilis TaxID=10195 RepID=A0A3M7PHW3_BRAPC|nr:hypothetical protein BpHYR1_025777 [Brachionus plicatilis]